MPKKTVSAPPMGAASGAASSPAPDLVIVKIASAPIVLVRPVSERGRRWIQRETDAGDTEPLASHGGAYPVEAEYLDGIVRGALAAKLVIEEKRTPRRRARRSRRVISGGLQ